MKKTLLALIAMVAVSISCYHATIETGRPESGQMITKAWASGWIAGLIPPSTVSTAAQCPNGVARVETQLSFVNMLVSALTLNIYSPMNIKVACASGGSASAPDIRVPPGAEQDEVIELMAEAADRAVALRRPIIVQF